MVYDKERWPNFPEREISCHHCGKNEVNPEALDKLQELRNRVGKALVINSAYRCPAHNKYVGGAKNSRHVHGDAFDISITGHNKEELLKLAQDVGFTGFGYYKHFLHVDTWNPRSWGSW